MKRMVRLLRCASVLGRQLEYRQLVEFSRAEASLKGASGARHASNVVADDAVGELSELRLAEEHDDDGDANEEPPQEDKDAPSEDSDGLYHRNCEPPRVQLYRCARTSRAVLSRRDFPCEVASLEFVDESTVRVKLIDGSESLLRAQS